jgi:aspartate-semialdehyde dehydrogenase
MFKQQKLPITPKKNIPPSCIVIWLEGQIDLNAGGKFNLLISSSGLLLAASCLPWSDAFSRNEMSNEKQRYQHKTEEIIGSHSA